MKIAIIIFVVFPTITAFGQLDQNFITKAQALKDLEIFQTSLEQVHPNIYRYTAKADFDQEYENIKRRIGETIIINEFYNLIAPVIALVRCGHTFGIAPPFDNSKNLFPLDVKILENKLFVLRNLSRNQEILAGAELLTINGLPVIDLINELRITQSADGYGVNFKDRIIEKDFRRKFATFVSQPDSFRIEFRSYKTSKEKQSTIAALTHDSIAQRLSKLPSPDAKPLNFLIDAENNVAILKLGSFMAKNIKKQNGQNLRKTIHKSFKRLRDTEIDNLIIDLRGNTGGKVFATPLLFSYLTDKEFKVVNKITFRHGYKFNYPEYLNRNKFNDWVNRKLDRKINDSTYAWTHHKLTKKTFSAKRSPFKGKVYILINGLTASAGAEFASVMKAHNRAIFVGEETGGDYNGVNGFDRTYISLPNSGIGVLVAGWRSTMAWEEDKNIGHGVLPDYEIDPSIEDLLEGQDTEMEFTYNLIKKE